MKKATAFALALVMTLGMGATVMAEENTALDRVLESGKIVLATDAAWAPFEYMEGENVVGADIEIAAKIAEHLGVELEIVNVAFDSLPMYLENGEADIVLAAMTVTEERAEVMEFSAPYCDSSQYIIVKEGDENVEFIDDLGGYIVGVHLGTTGDFLVSDEVNMGVLMGTKCYGSAVQRPFYRSYGS